MFTNTNGRSARRAFARPHRGEQLVRRARRLGSERGEGHPRQPTGAMAHDAIVIGSGPNGLSAAITLAQAGRSVVVLEAAARPGGAVATEELTLPGFRHDTFSAVYPAAAASPVFARLPLERHGLEWVHPRYCMAHPQPDGSAAVLARDLGETATALNRLHAGDGDALGARSRSRTCAGSARCAARCWPASRRCAAPRSCSCAPARAPRSSSRA